MCRARSAGGLELFLVPDFGEFGGRHLRVVAAAIAVGDDAERDGLPLGKALAKAHAGDPVMDWFQGWAADGLFTGVKFGR